MIRNNTLRWHDRWFCPSCERIFTRRNKVHQGHGYHSWKCREPLALVDVTIRFDRTTPTRTTGTGGGA